MAEGDPTLSLPGEGAAGPRGSLGAGEPVGRRGERKGSAPSLSGSPMSLPPPPGWVHLWASQRTPPWLSPSPTLLTHRGRGSPSLLLIQPLPSQPPCLQIENHVLLSPQTQVTPRYDAPPQPSRPLLWGGGRRGARPPWSPQRQRRPVRFPSQHRERLLYGRSSRGKRIPKGTGSVAA
ncbi:Hypothetical predicted protein [Podarcis lilfordi]|uniref:Uncharacterized protein n=1 Tax=Podarcis lilfordi TaxID=74358 RepID=A0AA35P264_9SAUR|nr:Hypothetical predicted protein [Podarcis lilfordi]